MVQAVRQVKRELQELAVLQEQTVHQGQVVHQGQMVQAELQVLQVLTV